MRPRNEDQGKCRIVQADCKNGQHISIPPSDLTEYIDQSSTIDNAVTAITSRIEVTVPARPQRRTNPFFFARDAETEKLRAIDPNAAPYEL